MARQASEILSIYNKSKQTISLQARPPKGDFFLDEQQIRIRPKETVQLDARYIMEEQIKNLASKGLLKIVRRGGS